MQTFIIQIIKIARTVTLMLRIIRNTEKAQKYKYQQVLQIIQIQLKTTVKHTSANDNRNNNKTKKS